MMTPSDMAKIHDAVVASVLEAIEAVGVDGVRAMSMFPSNAKAVSTARERELEAA